MERVVVMELDTECRGCRVNVDNLDDFPQLKNYAQDHTMTMIILMSILLYMRHIGRILLGILIILVSLKIEKLIDSNKTDVNNTYENTDVPDNARNLSYAATLLLLLLF